MGHDIYGVNKEGREISYIRFSMGNTTSYLFYEMFDAMKYHGGVSGIGQGETYTEHQVEQVLTSYQEMYGLDVDVKLQFESDFESYEKKEMLTFIKKCLKTAKEEGAVTVLYG